MRSVQVALRKRAVEPERVEHMINGVVRQLESQTDGDIPTDKIGELVMEGLKALDDIAYVRFASVYRNFAEARDFNAIVGELEAEPEPPPRRKFPANAGTPPRHERNRRRRPAEDLRWMDAALNLGSRSLGLAAPNPAVGAILVKDGMIVGRGATAPGGRPHAERIAIARLAMRRAVRRSMSRSNLARISGPHRPAPTPSLPPAWPASSRRWKIPIRSSPDKATHS